jgi:ferredoxin
MIISEKKPIEELMLMLGDAKKIALVGCASCATACSVGGEKEMAELKEYLEAQGREVVATAYPGECCHKLLVKKELKAIKASGAEAIVGMSCGDGVGTVAEQIDIPVYPANNTLFLGQVERIGMFHEYCRMCGDCVLGSTGGICPVTQCAKSLVNGPCGGQKNGKCEVNPENDCAWIKIYERLVATGQEYKLFETRPDKGHADSAYPRHINLREAKK